jgi:phosphoribosylformylglycinamidine cyclo-ligase
LIDGRSIAAGDAVLGLASSGAHANGYSLVRKILERTAPALDADFHGRPFSAVLLEPTRIYVKSLLALMGELPVKGCAHITGGGLVENVPRVLPEGVSAIIEKRAWPRPPLFDWLQKSGGVDEGEMHRVFNCGIGMVVIVAEGDVARATASLEAAGETVFRIGRIEARSAGSPATRVV